MAEYNFSFPPITDLTIPQQDAVDKDEPIALSGGPGTGKSFVSLWRHIINHRKPTPVKSQLLTFTTSLAYYLKKISIRELNDEVAEFVDSTQHWYHHFNGIRDEIIVDEAQDMELSFYEDSNRLRRFSHKISYGADNKQILQVGAINPDSSFNIRLCSPQGELKRIFGNEEFCLDKNFRNTKSILHFAKALFEEAYIPRGELNSCDETGDKPTFFITNGNVEKQNKTIENILSQFNEVGYNIAILTPLAKRPYIGGEIYTARYYFDFLNPHFDCSVYDHTMHGGHGLQAMKNIHITPFKSSKGLEFDTVIIPCFHSLFMQFNVINWRDFFVAITRAKNNLFFFSDKDINTYISDPYKASILNLLIDKQIL
jgi:superfamily I DNA/RNA helicase